jgi:hypothetical protein
MHIVIVIVENAGYGFLFDEFWAFSDISVAPEYTVSTEDDNARLLAHVHVYTYVSQITRLLLLAWATDTSYNTPSKEIYIVYIPPRPGFLI